MAGNYSGAMLLTTFVLKPGAANEPFTHRVLSTGRREPRGEEAVHATRMEGKRSQHAMGCERLGRKANLIRLEGQQGDIPSLGE